DRGERGRRARLPVPGDRRLAELPLCVVQDQPGPWRAGGPGPAQGGRAAGLVPGAAAVAGRNRRGAAERGGAMGFKVIAFANQKGGVAKTTTTLNLAAAFGEEGHRVLCVDMDPQGNLTMSQGIDPDTLEKSMYDVLVHKVSIREVIRKREIDVACASID